MVNVEIWKKSDGRHLTPDEIDDLFYNAFNIQEVEWEVSKAKLKRVV